VQFYDGRVYVPVASLEEALAMDANYLCCVFRGSVISYDALSGKQVWKQYTITEQPTATGKTTDGKPMIGPSGAAVWSAVTIDQARNRLYIGTGDNYSNPTSDTSDAIVALDLNTGEPIWTYQGSAGDAWTVGCTTVQKVNCPEDEGPDVDMGASPILVTRSDGTQILLAAQNNGVAHAIDPDKQGAVLWKRKVAEGGVQGGLQWGQATDGKVVYTSLSDSRWLSDSNISADVELDPNAGGGLVALELGNGEVLWEAPPISCAGRERCSPAQPAAVTAIEGVVFSGSVSGEMRAFASATGKEIWRYDTVRDFDTVNGAKGRGGAIDQGGAVIVDGSVYFNSGYAKWGANPGNVLLVFGLAD
jgi:polyvinyl alcohol dehydrogenase (cytochrome)